MQVKTLLDQQIQITGSMAQPQTINSAPVSLDQYLEGLEIVFQGRLAIGTAAATAIAPEAPQGLVRRFKVKINHDIYGSQTCIDLPGATIFERNFLFNQVKDLMNQTPALATAIGNYDIDLHWVLHFPLEQVVESEVINSLLDAPRCSSIQVEIDLGIASDLLTPGGTTTFAWTAYGSATGNPIINISRRVVNGLTRAPLTNLVLKHDRVDTLNQSITTGTQNGQPLPTGNVIRLIGFKQYQANANNVDVASSMIAPVLQTDTGLARVQLFVGSNPIRDFYSWQNLVTATQKRYGVKPDPGYGVIDFVGNGYSIDSLDARLMALRRQTLGYGGIINAAGATSQNEVWFDEIILKKGK